MRHSPTRPVFATVLLVQPLVQLAEQATDPQVGASAQGAPAAMQVAAIAAHPEQRLLSILLGLVGIALVIPLAQGLGSLTADRTPRLGRVGAWMMVVGAVAFAALHGSDLAVLAAVTAGTPDPVGIWTAVMGSPAMGPLTGVFLLGMMGGLVVLCVALWRSRAVPLVATALLGAFVVIDVVAAATGSTPVTLLAHATLWVGSALVARTAIRQGASLASERVTVAHPSEQPV